jgi:type IV secretion system protein TrbF
MASQAAWKPWDDRYANQALAIRNWQLAFGATTLFAFISLGAALWMAGRIKYVVYVTSVDHQGYAVTQLQPLTPQTSPDVIARIQAYEIAKYIREARSVSSDLTVDHQAAEDLYAHTRGSAANFLNDYFLADDKAHDPLQVAQKNTVSVQVESILPLSAKTWQVRWQETRYDLQGNVDAGPTYWTAQLQTELVTPKSADVIVVNPIGFMVTQISWAQEASN